MPVSRKLPVACAMLLSLALAACNHDHNPTAAAATPAAPASAAADKYEPAKMDLKPPPAVLSAERHTGPFAQGSALSMDARVRQLDPAPVK